MTCRVVGEAVRLFTIKGLTPPLPDKVRELPLRNRRIYVSLRPVGFVMLC